MLVVGKARRLRRQRGRHRALPRAAGENHLLALGIGNGRRIESLERNDHAVRIGFHRDLVRLANIDQKIAAFRYPAGNVFRGQIVHLMVRHAISS